MLLAVLVQGAGHGYDLARRVADRSGGKLTVAEGSLYPALHRLERQALVTSDWATADGRRRRVYRLTRSGRRAVVRAREDWESFSRAVDAVMVAVA